MIKIGFPVLITEPTKVSSAGNLLRGLGCLLVWHCRLPREGDAPAPVGHQAQLDLGEAEDRSGVDHAKIAAGRQLGAAPEFAPYIENMLGTGPGQRLTRAALETLTIIAYKQPCTRAEIEAIRGVNSDRLVAILEQRGLIDNVGTGEGPGRPKLYRTTMRFLEHFGIKSPRELPPLPEAREETSIEAEI